MSIFSFFQKRKSRSEQNLGATHKGGYLAFYGLWDWYESQPKEIREFLYNSCGRGINTDSNNLIRGDIYIANDPEDEAPWTATKFLCNHAFSALRDRNHAAYYALMEKARDMINSLPDREYYIEIKTKTSADIAIYPDQKEIEAAKPVVKQMIEKHPGVLQSDLKKKFPKGKEAAFGIAYSNILDEGGILREKAGRTFKIYVRQDGETAPSSTFTQKEDT